MVLTSLKVTRFNDISTIDEFTGVAAILLMASSLFSFLSIRTEQDDLAFRYEKIADFVFLTALLIVFLITFLIAFSVF